ncbi:hypothetical protein F5Y14DRAFT_463177 [Nemania sp. NC0429]|nr:hypothetical protein F5Y14DRAFT_463177 [Nemania sp. NC0429]
MYPTLPFDNTGAWNRQLPSGQASNRVDAGLPPRHMPTGHGPAGTTPGPRVPGPDVSGRTATPPRSQPADTVGPPTSHKHRVPEFGAAEQELKDALLENQRGSWVTKFLFPEEASADAQEKNLSNEADTNQQAPVAPMSEGDLLLLADIPGYHAYQAFSGDTLKVKESSSEDSEDDDSDTPEITTESASDSSSTIGRESLPEAVGPKNESNPYNDGVVNIQTKNNYGTATGAVDIDNSLRIGRDGKFHLGLQWQVPDARTAHSNAGPKLGPVSLVSSWSTNERNAEEDSSRLGHGLDNMEHSLREEDSIAASPPHTPVRRCQYDVVYPEETGSDENHFCTVVEKINDMDLSMTGVR